MDNKNNEYKDFLENSSYNTDSDEIYSSSKRTPTDFEDISSSSKGRHSKPKKKKKKVNIFVKILAALICVVLIAGIVFYSYAHSLISKMDRTELDKEDLSITTSTYSDVKNIALLGIDSRKDNNSGRSDAIVVLTIDKTHKKIKLTSIARDSYVAIDGYKNQKITHAYAFGKSQLAVKTLNQNYGLEITDYVTMNFFELARVIDYIGGVTVDVDEAEFKELNSYIIPKTKLGDIPCEKLKSSGVQRLSGGQAVCYARIRHTDSDIGRGNRQKEVLTAMFDEVKKMNPLKLPEVAEMVLSECETSLTTNDIIALGSWALISTPSFEQLSIPNDNVPSKGTTINGAWVYSYDLEVASKEIHDFIFEEGYYSPEEVAKRESEKAE